MLEHTYKEQNKKKKAKHSYFNNLNDSITTYWTKSIFMNYTVIYSVCMTYMQWIMELKYAVKRYLLRF